MRSTLGFLEKLTLRPDTLTREDAETVLATGVTPDGLVDAIHVAALFNMIVRLADSFGWYVPPNEQLAGRADAMLQGGYRLATSADVAAATSSGAA